MYLSKLTRMYVNNYGSFRNPKRVRRYLLTEFQLIDSKRKKLRLGRIGFEYSDVRHNGRVLTSTFQMKFLSQSNQNAAQRQFQETYEFATWKWDLKNLTAALFIFFFVISGVRSYFNSLALTHLSADVFSPDLAAALLKFTFDSALRTQLSLDGSGVFLETTTFISTVMVDMCLFMGLLV